MFYSLGSLGSAARDPLTALVYMQFAHHLAEGDELITLTVAEFYEQLRQNQRAADTYARIPPTSVFGNRAAIGRAAALERLEKTDEAIETLKALLALHRGDGPPRVHRMIERQTGSLPISRLSTPREMADPLTDPTRSN